MSVFQLYQKEYICINNLQHTQNEIQAIKHEQECLRVYKRQQLKIKAATAL